MGRSIRCTKNLITIIGNAFGAGLAGLLGGGVLDVAGAGDAQMTNILKSVIQQLENMKSLVVNGVVNAFAEII